MGLLDQLSDKLNKLKGKKEFVGVSISSRSILEVVQFDHETKEILKYGQTELDYDITSKQINNVNSLEMEIKDLFEELGIPLHSSVVLSLPVVSLSHLTLPSSLDNESTKYALISEAEKNYIFKNHEPMVSWEKIAVNEENDTQYLLYSAVKKQELESIEEIFDNLGIHLLGVDASYSSLLRGLAETGLVDEDIKEGKCWNVLLITVNSFVIISFMGDKIIDITEDPIAIKSFNPEDIYPSIASYSLDGVSAKSSEHIVIISTADEVSAKLLSSFFDMECKVSYVDSNNNSEDPIFKGDVDLSDKRLKVVGLQAIGTTCWKKSIIPVNFNFLSNKVAAEGYNLTILGSNFTLTSELLQNILIGLIILAVISNCILYFIGSTLNGMTDMTLQELNTSLNKDQDELKKFDQPVQKTDVGTVIKNTYDNDTKVLENFNTISSVIPEKLWLESFTLKSDLSSEIKGKALAINDIIAYYQNLNRVGNFQNLKISSVKETEDSKK